MQKSIKEKIIPGENTAIDIKNAEGK